MMKTDYQMGYLNSTVLWMVGLGGFFVLKGLLDALRFTFPLKGWVDVLGYVTVAGLGLVGIVWFLVWFEKRLYRNRYTIWRR